MHIKNSPSKIISILLKVFIVMQFIFFLGVEYSIILVTPKNRFCKMYFNNSMTIYKHLINIPGGSISNWHWMTGSYKKLISITLFRILQLRCNKKSLIAKSWSKFHLLFLLYSDTIAFVLLHKANCYMIGIFSNIF